MKTTLFGLFGKVEIAAKQLRDSLVYFKLKVVAGAKVILEKSRGEVSLVKQDKIENVS